MSSPLSLHVKRVGKVLRDGAEDQVVEAGRRLEVARGLYDALLSRLLVSGYDVSEAYETALEMFGSPRVRFAAVDGSQDQRLVGGLAVFWGGAYAATGSIEFRRDAPPRVEYHTGFVEHGRGVSSCIPLYVDRVWEVDQTVLSLAEPGQVTVTKPLTEQGVVDNSSIAGWVMTFSELFLAYKLVREEDVKILLLDRSLSGTQTSLMYDTSRKGRWKTDGGIHGLEVEGLPIDVNEMAYGRHYIANSRLGTPPARGDYLHYAIIYLLQRRSEPLTLDEICMELKVRTGDRCKRVEKSLAKTVRMGYIEESSRGYVISPRYAEAWNKIKRLILWLGHKLFETESGNPLRVETLNGARWLTTLDFAFLSLYTLYMLLEESWSRGVLLIGVTKDTTARDFKSHVIPVCAEANIWKIRREAVESLPSTDRMLLQAVSLFNYDRIPVPWSLIEYDSAFQTIIPDLKHRSGYVSGAIENKIIPERLFVKSYVQLEESDRDPRLRSNVLHIDRLAYPEYDLDALIRLKHEYAGAVEPIEPILYKDNSVRNRIQNLVMMVLASMSAKSVPEVFGHNKALFIADKIAKAQRIKIKGLIDALGHWLLNNRRLKAFSFYMHTFRERRGEIEYARRGAEG